MSSLIVGAEVDCECRRDCQLHSSRPACVLADGRERRAAALLRHANTSQPATNVSPPTIELPKEARPRLCVRVCVCVC